MKQTDVDDICAKSDPNREKPNVMVTVVIQFHLQRLSNIVGYRKLSQALTVLHVLLVCTICTSLGQTVYAQFLSV